MTDNYMVKISEVKAGDILLSDGGFTCIGPQQNIVKEDANGLYIECSEGRHGLDGQEGWTDETKDYYVGFKKL